MSHNNNSSNNFSDYHYNFDMNAEYLSDYREPQNLYGQSIVSPQISSQPSNNNNFPLFSTQTSTNYHGDNDVDENRVDNLSTPTSGNYGRANFSVKEDEALISSFIRVSEDGTVGTNKIKGVFWQRVLEQYDLARAANPEIRPRTIGMIDNRFRRISTIIMSWGACYMQASRRKGSGCNEDNVLAETRVLYKSKFNLDHAWDMLKVHPKWSVLIAPYAANACKAGLVGGTSTGNQDEGSNSSGKRVRLDNDEYSTPISTDESVYTQRPEGRNLAKRNKGKKKVNNVEYEDLNTRFSMMNESTQQDLALAREKLEFKKKNAEAMMQQLAYNNKREERKRKEQELAQRTADWDMLQQLLHASSLPQELVNLKAELLKQFGGR